MTINEKKGGNDTPYPTLVLLPGLDGTSVLFRPLIERLKTAVIAVDYPQKIPSGYADLLPFVRSQLPLDRPFVLLGWSFSGPLALMTARDGPPGLKGVALAASFVRKPVFYAPSAFRHFVRPFLFFNFSALSRFKALVLGHSTSALGALLREAHSQAPPAVMAHRVRATLSVNVESELADCPVPVLYLRSSTDMVVPKGNLRRIQRLRPDVSAAVIPGPHLALATNPEAAANAIHEFLESLENG